MVNDDGTPYPDYGTGSLLENTGDVQEVLEQCYGMVWWLAEHRARLRFATTTPTREQVMDVIRSARENHREGARRGRGTEEALSDPEPL
jgi:hypothetical protein